MTVSDLVANALTVYWQAIVSASPARAAMARHLLLHLFGLSIRYSVWYCRIGLCTHHRHQWPSSVWTKQRLTWKESFTFGVDFIDLAVVMPWFQCIRIAISRENEATTSSVAMKRSAKEEQQTGTSTSLLTSLTSTKSREPRDYPVPVV